MNGGPVISIEQLSQAVEAHRRARGRFPVADDGHALPDLAWKTIDRRLRDGHRGSQARPR